jgi:hypothetical protein
VINYVRLRRSDVSTLIGRILGEIREADVSQSQRTSQRRSNQTRSPICARNVVSRDRDCDGDCQCYFTYFSGRHLSETSKINNTKNHSPLSGTIC